MARILSAETCAEIKRIRADKTAYTATEKGWMCEGSDVFTENGLIFFNNDTDEAVYTNSKADVLRSDLSETHISDIMPFIKAECRIAQLVEG